MGILDRAKKKKNKEKEFLDLGEDLDPSGGDYGPAGMSTPKSDDDAGMPGLPTGPAAIGPSSTIARDVELLNSKISALKSEMEALKQRIRFIESKLDLGEKEESSHKYGTPAPAPKDTGWHY